MALKNLYDMVKADRYTADGREALIKAQEAETEDKVYQIGEISQKTGLQKTANGWVKPKNGKQPGAKKQNAPTGSKKIDYQVTEKGGKFYATGHQFSDGSQLHAGPFGSEKELHEFMNGSPYKSTAESKPGAKKEEPKNVHGAEVDKIYERQLKRIKELKAKGFTDEQIDNDKIIKQTKEDMKNVGKKPESKPAEKHPPMVMPKGMSPAEFMKAWEDDAKKNGFKKGQGNEWREHLRKEEAESKPAAPRREAVSAGRMMKDLDGNFWSRPEDFKEDITSRGWDVDEMTNEYAVISNEAGSQYEVRFDDHSDDGDLTVRNFKALQIDEDDDDDSLEDAAPSLSEIVDRVYNIGEISEKTGLQKTANGWRPVKKGAAPAKKQEKKGAGIPQTTTETFVGKTYKDFVESATPSGYKPTKNTDNPDGSSTTVFEKEGKQLKVDFDKSGKITKVTPGESKPAASSGIPDFHGMESGDYDNKLRAEGWTTGGWEGNGTHASAIFKKGDRTIRVNEGKPGTITSVEEINKDSAPRVLTGDCRIRIRKEKPALTGDTKIRVRK